MLRTAKPRVSRMRKPQLYGATLWAVVSLLHLAFISLSYKSLTSLVSRVVNKPNTQLTLMSVMKTWRNDISMTS